MARYIIGLIIQIVFTVIAVKTAQKKNRNAVLWGISTFFFGLIPLIIILCLSDAE
jgi:predicted PurR-regulated permease PerM